MPVTPERPTHSYPLCFGLFGERLCTNRPTAAGDTHPPILVDDIDDVVARLRSHGGELVGALAQYEDIYRLCFVRGPEGIIIGLAEQLG